MNESLKIIVLVDNSSAIPGLHAEHGLSFLVEAAGRRVLFDTGSGEALPANVSAMRIRLAPLDALVLSHGHYDHTGGVAWLLGECMPDRVYVHPDALCPKYARRELPPARQIGIPPSCLDALNRVRERIVWTASPAEVAPGIWCTGEIPRQHPASQPEGYFYLDPDCERPDSLADDQALIVETPRGIVVICGCTHSGVANTLNYVNCLTGRRDLYALAGGLHLHDAPAAALESAAAAIARRSIQVVAPCHCTGPTAREFLRRRLGASCPALGAGSELVIE